MKKSVNHLVTLFRFAALVVVTVVVATIGTDVSRAEVAVDLAPNASGPATAIISVVGIIIDDGDPMVWDSFRPTTPLHIILNPGGVANGDGAPHILRIDSGRVLVVWAKNQGGHYEIVMSEFNGTSWSAEQTLALSVDNALDPVLVRNPANDGFDLVYWTDGANPTVWRKQAPADLSTWSAAESVSLPSEVALRPSAVYYAGKLHVAYEVHADNTGAGPHEIALAVDDAGNYQFETVTVTPYLGEHRPKLQARTDRLWLEWVDTDAQVCWDRQQQPGVWDGIAEQPFQDLEDRIIHVPGRIRVLALN